MVQKFLLTAFSLASSVIAFGAISLISTPAYACDSAFYNHNGSIMEVHVCNGSMVVEYDKPRASLRKHGVKPGTVLFRGNIYAFSDAAKINGQANVFLKGCSAKSYEVKGWMEGNEINMAGQAPVRGANCKVRKYRNDNLLFTGL